MSHYDTCSICASIPNQSTAYYTVNESKSSIPDSAERLTLIGSPYFTDDLNTSKTRLKRCPECGTYYEWHYEYEYHPTGSEDFITLTRLSDEEGQRRADDIAAIVQQGQQDFETKLPAIISQLEDAQLYTQLHENLEVLSQAQLVAKQDISEAVPALLVTLSEMSKLVNSVQVLFHPLEDDPGQAQRILNLIESEERIAPYTEAIEKLRERCQNTLDAVSSNNDE